MIALLLSLALQGAEADYYAVDYLTPPAGEVLEVGGMDFLPDGNLVLSTRRGQVWIVENPLADDPAEARFRLFAEGLNEGLGLSVVDGHVYVVQRGELSRLLDTDGDGSCDRIDTVCDGWGLSGNYHEFAYGLPVDDDGNFYVSLNVSFFAPKWWHGKSTVPWRGWVLRISPDGEVTPVASGFRSPCGIDRNAEGDLFVTDNQGDWMAVSPIFHLKEGEFYGHPASLAWTPAYREAQAEPSDTVPPEAANARADAAVWLPYKWSRSPGNLVPDTTGGAFGPFGGQMFLAELTNGMVLRVMLERVRGEYQGAVVPFRQKLGSACRVRFAPDATLFVGMTNRGWGGLPPASGLARIRWTGVTPMEIEGVHLLQRGFEVKFTKPLAGEVAPESVRLVQYDYDYWWEYGSPERALETVEPFALGLSPDRRTLTIRADLTPGKMARVELFDVAADDGSPLLHNEFAYTINQLPEGEPTPDHVVKIVPPPPGRESGEEGWLRLTFGDATDGWTHEGWELVDAELDPDDTTRLMVKKGVNALTNTGNDAPTDYASKQLFGDARIHAEFMLPDGGDSGILLMGRYEIDLRDSDPDRRLTPEHCGGIAAGAGFDGAAPRFHAYSNEGQWHKVDVDFQAPRFDAAGRKVENARILRVQMDGTLLHENVELPGPTAGLEGPEVAAGPLVLQGARTHVAFGNVRVRPSAGGEEEAGWTYLWTEDDEELEGWKTSGEAIWTLDDGVLIGEGPRGHIFSPRSDYGDHEIKARVKINVGGNSGLYFRTAYGDGWPAGYEAQINSSYADPQKTGSLYGLVPIKTHLVSSDTWFDYHVTCRDVDEGTHVMIRVNGVIFADYVDAERRHGPGHIALQQHHDGSVVEVKELRVRELD
ncbi:MAG: family 16 glycoside hydrolase [Planctomycetota bacterium]